MRADLPAIFESGTTFLTFGGTETHLLFQQGYALREFCAFEVVDEDATWTRLEEGYLRPIADAAARNEMGILADCLVWRASTDYVERLGHTARGVAGVNRAAVARVRRSLDAWRASSLENARCPVLLSADIGPRGDGYAVSGPIGSQAARDYHRPQVAAVADAGVDLAVALTMTSAGESIGLVEAAGEQSLAIVVSPTVETDGTLPDGTTLGDFIGRVDDATGGAPLFYLVNCAHPTHLEPTLRAAADAGAGWLPRLRGFRANASTKSHAELDDSTELDRGDPADLARHMAALRTAYGLRVIGGCCGTDAEHLLAIADCCAAPIDRDDGLVG